MGLCWGAIGEAMLPKLHGMFAFVIWEQVARRAFAEAYAGAFA